MNLEEIEEVLLSTYAEHLHEDKNIGTFKNIRKASYPNIAQAYPDLPKFQSLQKSLITTTNRQFNTLEISFKNELNKVISSLERKHIELESALKKGSLILNKYYKQAYGVGLYNVGGNVSPEVGLSASRIANPKELDLKWLKTSAESEMVYLGNFLKDVDERKKGKLNTSDRLDLYVDSLRSQFDAGKVVGAPPLSVIYWQTAPAEHCKSCLWLEANSPWLKENIPTTPKGGITACNIGCKCRLEIGQLPYKDYLVLKNNAILRSMALIRLKQLGR